MVSLQSDHMHEKHTQAHNNTTFLNHATASTENYTLSLHDALPIWTISLCLQATGSPARFGRTSCSSFRRKAGCRRSCPFRSEEHTSELQSHVNLVCRLLLEKKKRSITIPLTIIILKLFR